jgi:hypothetical protein
MHLGMIAMPAPVSPSQPLLDDTFCNDSVAFEFGADVA